jgi:hypothetical protein
MLAWLPMTQVVTLLQGCGSAKAGTQSPVAMIGMLIGVLIAIRTFRWE